MNESNDVTMRGENVPEAMVASAVAAQSVAPGGSTAAISAAPVPPARRRGSKLARFFVILGIVLLSSVLVLPMLAEAMDSGSNCCGRSARRNGLRSDSGCNHGLGDILAVHRHVITLVHAWSFHCPSLG